MPEILTNRNLEVMFGASTYNITLNMLFVTLFRMLYDLRNIFFKILTEKYNVVMR